LFFLQNGVEEVPQLEHTLFWVAEDEVFLIDLSLVLPRSAAPDPFFLLCEATSRPCCVVVDRLELVGARPRSVAEEMPAMGRPRPFMVADAGTTTGPAVVPITSRWLIAASMY